MKKLSALVLCLTSFLPLQAQMTASQRMLDIQVLASMYAKQYAPYEWKRDVFQYDALNLAPWIERARVAKDDLEFYQIMAEYVASLNDAHDVYFSPSDFAAELPFNVDIYDGKVLVDFVYRSFLPLRTYPFDIGDELISIDGQPVADLLTELMKIDSYANPLSTRRWAADKLTYRSQAQVARAVELGDSAVVVIKLKSGATATYTIDWIKSGYPMKKIGPVPSPRLARAATRTATRQSRLVASDLEQSFKDTPPYMRSLLRLQYLKGRAKRQIPLDSDLEVALGEPSIEAVGPAPSVLNTQQVLGYQDPRPVFDPPAGFVQRLGKRSSDYFYSGTYVSQGKRIGYIRIADFAPLPFSLLSLATRQFDTEITFFNANTDGLVVDVMRNPGGYGCYAEALFASLNTKPFRTLGQEIRPTIDWVISFKLDLADAVDSGATANELIWLGGMTRDVETAYNENRGRTGSLPLCGLTLDAGPSANSAGVLTGYSKPSILLADEFTTSAGDAFAAIYQDNKRGPVVGIRTAGAGGSVGDFLPVGFYSEGFSRATQTLLVRPSVVSVPGYPVTNYLENVGVHPDLKLDYMTAENLIKKGAPFVQAFTDIMVAEINKPK